MLLPHALSACKVQLKTPKNQNLRTFELGDCHSTNKAVKMIEYNYEVSYSFQILTLVGTADTCFEYENNATYLVMSCREPRIGRSYELASSFWLMGRPEEEVDRRYVTKRIKGKVATGFDKEVEVVVVSHMVEEMAVVVESTVEEIMGEVEVKDLLEAQVVVVDGHDGVVAEANLEVEEVVNGGMEVVGEAVESVREEVVVDCKCSELEVVGVEMDTEREAAVEGNKQVAEVMEQMERS
ncbi:hypothetical protein RJ639_025357 [Escallonia herrerae]|uniref:Uncharacterized protein n=1 Tax=Escallonia herrerae TaxID=1293975 RepID=A0AA88S6D9_9ASTE|nr:hypothetical protein RJ639_025357 [Escallonia herrerae]